MSRIKLRPNKYSDNKICSECAKEHTRDCPREIIRMTAVFFHVYAEPYEVSRLMSERDGQGIQLAITDCVSFERCFFLSDIFKFLLNI